jgi:uncharacterized membrane protein
MSGRTIAWNQGRQMQSMSASNPLSKLRKLVAFALSMTILTGWDHPLLIDDLHTMLESIGQIAYSFPNGMSADSVIPNQAFWSTNSVGPVIEAVQRDNGNMMINYLATHACIRVFGTSQPYFLGLLSVLGFCLTIFLVYRLADMLFGSRVALWAATFCAFNSTLLELANYKRSYSFAIACSLVASIVYLNIVKTGNLSETVEHRPIQEVIAYAAATLVGFFSHFQFVHILIAHIVYACIFVRDRRAWGQLIASGLIVIVVVGIWLTLLGGGEAMRTYPELSRQFTFNEVQKMDGNSVAVVNPFRIVTSMLDHFLYFFGFDKLVPDARFRFKCFTLVIPAAVLLIGLIHRRQQASITWRIPIFLLLCSLISPLLSIVRSYSAGNLFGMWTLYQSFGIPYIMCLMAWISVPAEMTPITTRGTGPRFRSGMAWLMAISIMLGMCSYTLRFNAMTNKEPYLSLARSISTFRPVESQLTIHTPTLLDAQLLSFYLGPNIRANFVLDDHTRLDSLVADRMKRNGYSSPIVRFREFEELLMRPGLNSKFDILIDRFDGREMVISRKDRSMTAQDGTRTTEEGIRK